MAANFLYGQIDTVSVGAVVKGMWTKFEKFFTVIGYSRAAAELSRNGYHVEAKKLMMELTMLREDFKN
jgi:hypothetical protein